VTRRGLAGGLLAVAWLIAACASPPSAPTPDGKPRVHVVAKGDTLWSISQRYGTTVGAVSRANHLRNPHEIRIGQRLQIPGATRTPIPSRENPWAESDPRGRSAGELDLAWPIRGEVTSGFGMRNGAHHDGLDIQVPPGTRVVAAEAGRVVHSDGSLAGYGNTIIIKHSGRFSTVYAHNRRNLVEVGAFVEKGQVIAEAGRTGRASAPHLHFEVRRDGSPRNPLEYLP
jgi:murein DD-endopeptidase MepM/ murein hydrolase activator NlpD